MLDFTRAYESNAYICSLYRSVKGGDLGAELGELGRTAMSATKKY